MLSLPEQLVKFIARANRALLHVLTVNIQGAARMVLESGKHPGEVSYSLLMLVSYTRFLHTAFGEVWTPKAYFRVFL